MEKRLIGRGVLSGAVAGLATFVFARIFAEPVTAKAIAYESARDAVQDKLDRAAGLAVPAAGPDIFSRTVQSSLGIGAGLVLFGAAMGALVAVAYVVCVGRTGRIRPRRLGLLVPAFFFVGVYLVPFAKYPANPPAIGNQDTIRERGALYLVTVFGSCLLLFLAVYAGQKLHRRLGAWNASLAVGLGYVVAMTVVFLVLPPVHETPLPLRDAHGTLVFPGFPADVLARFRVYSVAAQVVLWGVLALTFAPLAERVLDTQARASGTSCTVGTPSGPGGRRTTTTAAPSRAADSSFGRV
jgi:predicted cobalt transporter CbtA